MLSLAFGAVKATKKKLCLALTQFRHSNTFQKYNRAIALPEDLTRWTTKSFRSLTLVLYSPAKLIRYRVTTQGVD